jgi:lysophospholipase L1-like esterase
MNMKHLLQAYATTGARLVALGVIAVALCAAPISSVLAGDGWLTTWAGPAQDPGTTGSTFPPDTTIREAVWGDFFGDSVRVKLSNLYGTTALAIGSASIGIKFNVNDQTISPATLRALTFGGKPSVSVPPGGVVLSDEVALKVPQVTDLEVSIYLPNGSPESVMYPGSKKTTYIGSGDQTQAYSMDFTSTSANGFFLAAVETHSVTGAGVVAAVGDSIVAGGGSTGQNTKWSDRLAVRLQSFSAPHKLSVLGLGIGGNRMLSGALSNPAALARFDSDVLGMAGLTHIIMADGINDLGLSATNPSGPPFPEDVENGLRQLVERAHARGVKVIGTTMGPAWGFRGYENIDFKRLAYNQWIRTVGVTILDGLIDFDAVLNDPSNPSHMLPQYLTDGIHPNNAGHQAMADAIDLNLFQ